jgi:hypothetical protein
MGLMGLLARGRQQFRSQDKEKDLKKLATKPS